MLTVLTLLIGQVPVANPAGDAVTLPPPAVSTPAAAGRLFPTGSSQPVAEVVIDSPADLPPSGSRPMPSVLEHGDRRGAAVVPAATPSHFNNATTLPASNPQVLTQPARRSQPTHAQALLRAVQASMQQQPLPGQSLTLTDAIARSGERSRRGNIVQIYWEQFTLSADLQFARDELARLQRAPSPRDQAGAARLTAAMQAAQARVKEAEMAVVTAQYALAEVTGSPADQPLLAVDLPLVGDYRTLYDTLFPSGGGAPSSLRRIDRTLPLRKQLLDARAAAVVAADQSVNAQLQAYQGGQNSVDTVLKSVDDLRQQRGMFLGAVRDYNLEVAQYAFSAAKGGETPQALAAMLIEAPRGSTVTGSPTTAIATGIQWRPSGGTPPATATPSTVVPAGATAPPLDASPTLPTTPREPTPLLPPPGATRLP